jgi:hypothetical protein
MLCVYCGAFLSPDKGLAIEPGQLEEVVGEISQADS